MKKDVEKLAAPAVQHKLYTTHDVSKLLQVDASTVSKWIDKKILLAFKTPGGHRRVQAPHLVAFLKYFVMPIPDELAPYKDQDIPGPTIEAVKLIATRKSSKSVASKRAHK